MSEILRKLSSRKLWAAVAGVVSGLAIVFGLDQSVITAVSGAAVSVASVIAYIVTEGKIDAEGVKNAIGSVGEAIRVIESASDDELDKAGVSNVRVELSGKADDSVGRRIGY